MLKNKFNRFAVFIDLVKAWQLGAFGIIITLGFAFSFQFISKYPGEGLVLPDAKKEVTFADALYFSIVTEATLGYGDIRPVGLSRWMACSEVFFGLVVAGMIVAKITSTQGRQNRLAAYMAHGYWIETNQMPGKPFFITFVQIYFNQNLHYDGYNCDLAGEGMGFFTGELLYVSGNLLRFQYSNKESITTHFVEGISNLSFTSSIDSKVWTYYNGTAHDFGTREQTPYEGYRADENEIKTFLGSDVAAKKKIVEKYANMHEVKPS